MADFKEFITKLMKRARINDNHIDQYTSDEHMLEFRKAFTHSSRDPHNNYEYYELVGDSTLNACTMQWITQKWPAIKSIKYLTRIKHNIISKKMLAHLARKQGLEDYILIAPRIPTKKGKDFDIAKVRRVLDGKDLLDFEYEQYVKEYVSILEDVMESFIGCISTIITKETHSEGVGYQIAYNLLSSFYDSEPISIAYEDIFDAISRLKELYEMTSLGLKWPSGEEQGNKPGAYVVTQAKLGEVFNVKVYGWPKKDAITIHNKVLLGEGTAFDKSDAKQKAAKQALATLKTVHKIHEAITSAYVQ